MIAELLFLKSGVVLGTGALASRALRRSSAATHAAIWIAAFAVLLALPGLEQTLPAWRPLATAPASDPFATAPAAAAPDARAVTLTAHGSHAPVSSGPAMPATRAPAFWLPWARAIAPYLLALWAAGVVVALLRLAAAHLRARALVRHAEPADDALAAAAAAAARRLGLAGSWSVAISDELDVPVQAGCVRLTVILPREAMTWDAARLDAVLLHELAHVGRRDCLLRMVVEVARAAYWPQPLVHLAARRALLALERAADDAVLRAGEERPAYAEHLAAIAALPGRFAGGAALAMARPSTLLPRVRAILDPRADRGALGVRNLVCTGFVAVIAAASIGAVTVVSESGDAVAARAARTRLGSPDAAARREAILTLGRLTDAASADAVAPLLRDADPAVRGVAAWALGRMHARAFAPALAAALRDDDAVVRELAGLALASLGDRRWVPEVAAMTRDTVWTVRAVGTEALRTIGGDDAAAAIVELLGRESDIHARSMALWALQELRSRHSLPGLVAALADTSVELRATALVALGELGDAAAFDAVAARLTDAAPMVRGRAAVALAKFHDARAVRHLGTLAAGDADWRVRVAAGNALGEIAGAEAARVLEPVLRDPVHQVRLTAAQSLDRIASH